MYTVMGFDWLATTQERDLSLLSCLPKAQDQFEKAKFNTTIRKI